MVSLPPMAASKRLLPLAIVSIAFSGCQSPLERADEDRGYGVGIERLEVMIARELEDAEATEAVVTPRQAPVSDIEIELAPRRDEMQAVLTEAVGAPVSVKGNRAERLGAIGRAEGVVCFATALIHRETRD